MTAKPMPRPIIQNEPLTYGSKLTEDEKGWGVVVYPPNMIHQSVDAMSTASRKHSYNADWSIWTFKRKHWSKEMANWE